MDLFRKNKKKQQDESTTSSTQIHAATEALDRIAISAAEDENDGIHINDGCHEHITNNETEKVGRTQSQNSTSKSNATSSRIRSSGIDALIDSDEDGAEIFTDGDSEEDPGNVSMVSDSSHRSPAVTEKVSLSPRQIKGQTLSSPYAKNGSQHADSDRRASLTTGNLNVQHDEEDDAEEISSSAEDGTTSDEVDDLEDEDKSNSDSAEDYTDDEDEGEDGYKPGGYHVVKVGEVFNQRYARFY